MIFVIFEENRAKLALWSRLISGNLITLLTELGIILK